MMSMIRASVAPKQWMQDRQPHKQVWWGSSGRPSTPQM